MFSLNLNWLSNYSCVIDLITTACGKHFNMKISESEKRFDIKMSLESFKMLMSEFVLVKNEFFNTGINVKIISNLTKKTRSGQNKTKPNKQNKIWCKFKCQVHEFRYCFQ